MSKHTPGPWVRVFDGDFKGIPWGAVAVGTHRHILVEGRSEEEAHANTRLISAAPELLEMLEEMVKMADENDIRSSLNPLVTKARAAIAKAKGE